MHKNVVWQAFLTLISAIALWYTIAALYSYYSYSHLKIQIPASHVEWHIIEKSEEHYLLEASYEIEFKTKFYAGSTRFADEPYRNQWAAEQAIKEYRGKKWKVWFDPQNPQYSSLQKNFPLKESVSAIFLWGLILYFLWLGFYVKKFK